MGAPVKDMHASEETSAETLLTALETVGPAERRLHASVLNYWLSIRGQRPFPAIRDLDPLEISDAGPSSVLMEMIGGGEDAEIRHLGHAIKEGADCQLISEAPDGSLLARIHARLPLVASSLQPLAFESEYAGPDGPRRCGVTLLPLSANGTWIDFVYAVVSLADAAGAAAPEAMVEEAADAFHVELGPLDQSDTLDSAPEPFEPELEPEPEVVVDEVEPEPELDAEPESEPDTRAGFSSKLLDGLASVGGFYDKVTQPGADEADASAANVDDATTVDDIADASEQPHQEPVQAAPAALPMEGSLQDKLTGVRAMAEEARAAQERSNLALYEGLGAAYDFALDAEAQPEEYLRLVESRGLKIQLRSPMTPVVKLAFADLTDDATIGQLEAVLAWALKADLPRGSLAERIQAEGGIGRILAA